MNGFQSVQMALYVAVPIACVIGFPFLVMAMRRETKRQKAATRQPAPRSQYNAESDAQLQSARQSMADLMTCEYCGEMNLPGMKCAACGARKPALRK